MCGEAKLKAERKNTEAGVPSRRLGFWGDKGLKIKEQGRRETRPPVLVML